jgi:hypothetical protein
MYVPAAMFNSPAPVPSTVPLITILPVPPAVAVESPSVAVEVPSLNRYNLLLLATAVIPLPFIRVLMLDTQEVRLTPGVIVTPLMINVPDITPTAAELNAVG